MAHIENRTAEVLRRYYQAHPKSVAGVHVVPNFYGGWSVRRTGSARASRVFKEQDKAIRLAREKAKREQTMLFIHRSDGTIAEMTSYGSGPSSPKTDR